MSYKINFDYNILREQLRFYHVKVHNNDERAASWILWNKLKVSGAFDKNENDETKIISLLVIIPEKKNAI